MQNFPESPPPAQLKMEQSKRCLRHEQDCRPDCFSYAARNILVSAGVFAATTPPEGNVSADERRAIRRRHNAMSIDDHLVPCLFPRAPIKLRRRGAMPSHADLFRPISSPRRYGVHLTAHPFHPRFKAFDSTSLMKSRRNPKTISMPDLNLSHFPRLKLTGGPECHLHVYKKILKPAPLPLYAGLAEPMIKARLLV